MSLWLTFMQNRLTSGIKCEWGRHRQIKAFWEMNSLMKRHKKHTAVWLCMDIRCGSWRMQNVWAVSSPVVIPRPLSAVKRFSLSFALALLYFLSLIHKGKSITCLGRCYNFKMVFDFNNTYIQTSPGAYVGFSISLSVRLRKTYFPIHYC